MNKTVFGWLADENGCGFYRILQPYNVLGKKGYLFKANASMQPSEDDAFDVIVAQRTCKISPSQRWEFLSKKKKSKLIFEVDDDLMNIQRSNEKAYFFFTHPETVDLFTRNAQIADLVTVSTEPLAEQMRKLNSNVKVIPNFIEENLITLPRFPIQVAPSPEATEPKPLEEIVPDVVTVGYTSSPTHYEDFALIRDQLILLQMRDPRMMLVFIGETYDMPRHLSMGWFDNIGEYYHNVNFDIGIAPLASNTFNNSKSYIKALEYAARGIPVVASDEPPYHDFVKHGETGFLFKQPYQFAKHLRDLMNDKAMREEMGAKAKEYAKAFTIEGNIHHYIDAYELEPQ